MIKTKWGNNFQQIKEIIENKKTNTDTKLILIHGILDNSRCFRYNFVSESALEQISKLRGRN
jgi:hypothetical protein